MPAISWLVNDNGTVRPRTVEVHTCFAPLSYYPTNSAGAPKTVYLASDGSWGDTKLWAEAVNKSSLASKHKFKLRAHHHSTKINNPFIGLGRKSSPIDYHPKGEKLCYWSITWPADTRYDEFYAVTKLIFKNITYGHRNIFKHAPMTTMIGILKQGGNIYEAMVHQAIFGGNGYGYPIVPGTTRSAIAALSFMEDGPKWSDGNWQRITLGSGQSISIYGSVHSPIPVSGAGRRVNRDVLPDLEDLHAYINDMVGDN